LDCASILNGYWLKTGLSAFSADVVGCSYSQLIEPRSAALFDTE
jgi:hypothetical protein